MTKILFIFLLVIWGSNSSWAAYTNYNSILIGERAAGMAGAFTALTGDPSAVPFYNPAGLARARGTSFSASVNIYNKYDTRFDETSDDSFVRAPLTANQGYFVPLPASSGSVYSFGNFAVGLSIVFPDFDLYTGEVQSGPDLISVLSLRDESLWIGGAVALNFTESLSLGMTMYYTARNFNRSIIDRSTQGGITSETTEEKLFTENSILYVLGALYEVDRHWKLGLSVRPPSIPISGSGSFYHSEIDSSGATPAAPINESPVLARTKIPMKVAVGISYERKKDWTVSMDLHVYSPATYTDIISSTGGEFIRHRQTINGSIGGEYFYKSWLAFRFGMFTNFASTPTPSENPLQRENDHIDMLGWSANAAFYTSPNSKMTLGGYYTGGRGKSVQQVAQRMQSMSKSQQIFSFLASTSFEF